MALSIRKIGSVLDTLLLHGSRGTLSASPRESAVANLNTFTPSHVPCVCACECVLLCVCLCVCVCVCVCRQRGRYTSLTSLSPRPWSHTWCGGRRWGWESNSRDAISQRSHWDDI